MASVDSFVCVDVSNLISLMMFVPGSIHLPNGEWPSPHTAFSIHSIHISRLECCCSHFSVRLVAGAMQLTSHCVVTHSLASRPLPYLCSVPPNEYILSFLIGLPFSVCIGLITCLDSFGAVFSISHLFGAVRSARTVRQWISH